MLLFKSKKMTLPLWLCLIAVLLLPALTQADTAIVLAASETGEKAANQAADQRAALAKKAEERRKAAEGQKSTSTPTETQKTDEEHQEKATEK